MYISVLLAWAALVCTYLWVWSSGWRKRRLLANLPSYPILPFIGNLHKFFGGNEIILEKFKEISNISEEENLPFVFWYGTKPLIILSDPDDISEATNVLLDKPYFYNFANIWLGDGLVTAPGSIWKHNIKKLSGTFKSSVVDGYQSIFNGQAQNLVHRLKSRVGAEPFVVMDYLFSITLETICQTALGVSRITESIVTDEYCKAFHRIVDLILKRSLNLVMHIDTIYKVSPSYKETMKCIGVLRKVSDSIIIKRMEEWDQNRSSEKERPENVVSKFQSFLDLLLELREVDPTFTIDQIKSEVHTIMLAGQETLATTLQYCLLMIGCKRDVQNKLYAEMRDIFGDSKRPVEKEDLSRMVYCEAVFCETLRLHPPFFGVMRYADKDLKIKSCTIPKGSSVALNIWGVGRSARWWGADAQEFRPERWLEPDFANKQRGVFLAFSTGRRACIGRKYAFALGKTMLAYCVREFEFSSNADKMTQKYAIVLRPATNHFLQVHLRTPSRHCKEKEEKNGV